METITATFQNGFFAPDGNVHLTEGTRVTLRVESVEAGGERERAAFSPLIPDQPLEPEEQGAPFDLPMPGGIRVKARAGGALLPDPPILLE